MLNIEIQKLPHAKDMSLPNYSSKNCSGLDLYAAIKNKIKIKNGDIVIIPTGIKIALKKNLEGQIRPRSGLAANFGITVLNTPGTIDADYRGEIKIILINHGKKVFEIEKICVATNTMNLQSFLNCRNYSFILKLLGQPVFEPVHKLTNKLGINWYDFSRTLTNVIQDENFKNELKSIYNEFCKESYNELFDSKEEAINFYSKPENYKSLLSGDIGSNLLAKYITKALLVLNDIFTTIFYVIRNKFNKSLNKELNSILNSSEKWLKNLYLIDSILADTKNGNKNNKHELKIDFDFPEWHTTDDTIENVTSNIESFHFNKSIE